MSEKTEEPTPQRLRKAREDGDSGVSVQAASAVAFLVAVALVPGAVVALADRSASLLRGAIERAGDATPSTPDPGALLPSVIFLVAPSSVSEETSLLVNAEWPFRTRMESFHGIL